MVGQEDDPFLLDFRNFSGEKYELLNFGRVISPPGIYKTIWIQENPTKLSWLVLGRVGNSRPFGSPPNNLRHLL